MIIDSLGRMGWITTKANVGSYPVTVTVTDSRGGDAPASRSHWWSRPTPRRPW